jgi:thiol-disulfide isomerase/thioredoxin
VLLALALVLAQIGAVTHSYTHLRLSGGNPNSLLSANGPVNDSALKLNHDCSDCRSFAPVLAAAGDVGPGLGVAYVAVVSTFVALHAPTIARRPAHSFQSRAPPLLA